MEDGSEARFPPGGMVLVVVRRRAGGQIARHDSPCDRPDQSTCPPDRAAGLSP